MSEKLESVSTYVIIIFVTGILAYLITGFALDLSNNEHANLSNDSEQYIYEITGGNKQIGFNTSIYNESVGKATEVGGNDNKNEFSIDFSFGDKTGTKIQRVIYVFLNVPEFFLMDVFRLVDIQWLVDLLDWVLNIFLFIAVVRYIRRG